MRLIWHRNPQEIRERDVLFYRKIFTMNEFAAKAAELRYPFFEWNGSIFETASQQNTGLFIKDFDTENGD